MKIVNLLAFSLLLGSGILHADDAVIQFGSHILLKDYAGSGFVGPDSVKPGFYPIKIDNADPNTQKDPGLKTGDKVYLLVGGKYLSARDDDNHHVTLADKPGAWEVWTLNAEPGATNQLTRQRKIWFVSAHGGRLHSDGKSVSADSGIVKSHSCSWYDIKCNFDKTIVKPFNSFIQDTANKVNDFVKSNIIDPINNKAVGPMLVQIHNIRDYARLAANLVATLPDTVADQLAPVIGGAKQSCTDIPDVICPAQSHAKTCKTITTPSLAQGLDQGAQTLAQTIATINAAIADIDKQKQAVIDEQLDKKQIQQLIDLNTILVGPNGAFDELKAALTSVTGPQGLGGLKTAFDTAISQAKTGQATIMNNLNGLKSAIFTAPKLGGVTIGESIPSRLNHIADVFNW
jgi:hypothetical protein